jgi:1-acyl-sn-glycerol-3-phosphate acyltransferase
MRIDWIYQATRHTAKVLLSPYFSLQRQGLDNIPQNSAFILLPKHQRWVDIPIISIVTPRPLYYIAKHELFMNPFSRWYIKSLGGLPLNRDRPIESRRSIYAMITHLENGKGLVVFPEGTYYCNKMGPGNIGIVRVILSRLALPFIPVGISYMKQRIRTKVRIQFGKPLFGDKSEPPQIFLDRVMNEIAKLSGLS